MPRTSPTTLSGAPKLSEVARKVSAPSGAVSTGWPAVARTCEKKMGVTFDAWQQQVGSLILAKRADGSLASTIDGVGMSLPRQVGKTYLIASMTFALCVNNPGLLVIWTAHHMGTSSETFLALQGFAKRPRIAPHIRQVFTGSGDEEVRFHNGSRILFGARERGFGRGIPGVDILIFDEAQILSDKAMANMLATMNTSRLGLHMYIGTPPKPEDFSESFSQMRAQAHAGTLDDGAWVEFGADPDADPDDRKQWAKANPSYPHRTPAQSIRRLKRKLSADDFRREALGIWDDDGLKTWRTIGRDRWEALAVPAAAAPLEGATAFAVKFSADGERVSCAVALRPDEGPVHVESLGVAAVADGTASMVEWLAQRWRTASVIVVDGRAGAGDLMARLGASGVPSRRMREVNSAEAFAAHAGMLGAIVEGDLTHLAQPGLDAQVRVAGRKSYPSGGWVWQAVTPDGDVTALQAVTLARHAVTTAKRRRVGSGEAVIA